ncbi:Peptidase domain containing protein [Pandoravirus celtis]|uniref:Peptidase domain containing protein n=1 Tax=Pandoravirus celtis TaxID=2568002 RepID=A0A4D6EHQ6_9VIRU|nr:Peptidase domain containing protein [Pandoravirus celtis]
MEGEWWRGVTLAHETLTAAAEHGSLARVDAAAALAERGLVLPDHFDGRRKWRRLLSPLAEGSVSAHDECARALADRVAIVSRGAVVVDLVAPHPDEIEPRGGGAHSPSLVALHRDQYVWGARQPRHPPDAARHVKSIAYYRPAPPDNVDGHNDWHRHIPSGGPNSVGRRDHLSDAVCAEIYLRGPVTTAIDVYEDLAWPEAYPASWTGGIYTHRPDAQSQHVTSPGRLGATVVSLVGWSTDSTGRRYYLARGGPAARLSPHDGVFCMWTRQCGIEEHAVAALPDLWGLRLPARFLHDAAPGDAVPGAAQRARDLRAAIALHPSGHTRAFVASLPPADRLALTPLVDPAHLPADYGAFVAGRVRNPHEAPGAHDPP